MRPSLIHAGMLLLAPVSALGIASAASAQSANFAYAPGTQRYRMVTEVHRNQIQGGGRAPFEYDVTTTQLLTVHLAPRSADTLALTLTVDSIDVSSAFNAPQPNPKPLIGAKLQGLISPQGRVYAFDPPAGTTDPNLVALYRVFRSFLIAFPVKPIAVGTSWADTTLDQNVKRGGFDVTARLIMLSRVANDTVVGGAHVWRVVRHGDIVQRGEHSNEGGEPVQMLGQGSVNGVHLFTHDGVFLSAQSTQRIDLTMKNSVSEDAPIQQTFKTTIERLPSGS